MTKTNLTLQLDAEVVRAARIVAAKRGTSVSALASRELVSLAAAGARYEDAMQRAQQLTAESIPRGGRAWGRDDLHQR